MNERYLVTTDNWFYAPDGKKYKSAWGVISILEDNVLGIKTNRNSSNWFAKIGIDDKYVIIAGCQIHYAVACPNRPHDTVVSETQYNGIESAQITRDSEIYIAE